MIEQALYPLRFDPIFQYRLWGGRSLEPFMQTPLPGDGPIGEAWILSDRDDHASLVAEGPLKGVSITDLMKRSKLELLGEGGRGFDRFPLLLKFLDVRQMLSVQVHPPDNRSDLIPPGERGKTEAWVVLGAEEKSRIYAGLKPGADEAALRSLTTQNADAYLASFTPRPGEGVLIRAGTVHSLGDGVMVFEVQENSDVTFRLYDWDHVDAKTGRPRDLQVDKALACVDYRQGAIKPVTAIVERHAPGRRERVFDESHFDLWRLTGEGAFEVGAKNTARILVCAEGDGVVNYADGSCRARRGDVLLIPAAVGVCEFQAASPATIFEIALPRPQ